MSDFDFDEAAAFEAAPLSVQAMAARPANYFEGLNPAQKDAVETLEGPVLMLAGAGTGKTKALTARIAHLLNTGAAQPNEILAVTFTNKAAREMKLRVGQNIGRAVEGVPWMGTFHSICVKLLRRHAELVGLKSNFTILDTDDQLRLLKQLIRAGNIDEKRWPPRMLAGLIDSWKNRGWTPSKVPSAYASDYDNRGTELYEKYQARLSTLNVVDFGDLLLHMVQIFQNHPDVLAQYQRWFKYILVDEYQDTNVAQYLWLRLLAAGHKNICCVGDDDQSIYGWRGAEVGNILRFEKDYPGAKVIKLEQNYRSTPHILGAAAGIISQNSNRLGKTLWTAETSGEKLRLISHQNGEEEARWIGEEIEAYNSSSSAQSQNRNNPRSLDLQQQLDQHAKHGLGSFTRQQFVKYAFETGKAYTDLKVQRLVLKLLKTDPRAENMYKSVLASPVDRYALNEIAILVRASFQMRAFEDRFLSIGLPYRVIGGPRFYERMEIRDAMAYFRVVVSPDDSLAFERIVNTPKRSLGEKALQTINIVARNNGVSMFEGARITVAEKHLPARACKTLGTLVQGFDRWSAQMHAKDLTHMELAEVILDESGYTDHWKNDKSIEAAGRLENLKELVKALEQFENLQGFLEHISLIMENEQDDSTEKVSIMTLHASKGLEFPCVFLPGWEDGLFPSQRTMDESGQKGVEEERRLAYVGITRAEEICTISFVSNRMIYGKWQSSMASRFIDELPPKHVEVLTPPSLQDGGYGAASPLQQRVANADVYNSPGWKRMQANSIRPNRRPGAVIDAQLISDFQLDERVFHQKFGYGTIIEIEQNKLTIAFEKAGLKNVLADYITRPDDVPF